MGVMVCELFTVEAYRDGHALPLPDAYTCAYRTECVALSSIAELRRLPEFSLAEFYVRAEPIEAAASHAFA